MPTLAVRAKLGALSPDWDTPISSWTAIPFACTFWHDGYNYERQGRPFDPGRMVYSSILLFGKRSPSPTTIARLVVSRSRFLHALLVFVCTRISKLVANWRDFWWRPDGSLNTSYVYSTSRPAGCRRQALGGETRFGLYIFAFSVHYKYRDSSVFSVFILGGRGASFHLLPALVGFCKGLSLVQFNSTDLLPIWTGRLLIVTPNMLSLVCCRVSGE